MRRAQRIRSLLVVVAGLALSAAVAPAGACSIAAVPVDQQVAQSAIAFTGTVQQVTPGPGVYELTVTPDRIVKGALPASVTLTTRRDEPTGPISSCSMSFAPGQRAAFLLGTAAPPWPVGLGNVLDAGALDGIAAPSEFHATAIGSLGGRPSLRALRVNYTAPSCAVVAAFLNEGARAVTVKLRTATPPACRSSAPVERCATVVLRAPLRQRALHPTVAARRVLIDSGPKTCPRVGAFAS